MNEIQTTNSNAPLTAEQKLAKRKEQNKLSQARYREAHKEEINAGRRKNYQCNKETPPPIPPKPAKYLKPVIPENEVVIPEDEIIYTGRKVTIKRKKTRVIPQNIPQEKTIKDALNDIDEFEKGKAKKSIENEKSQLRNFARWFGENFNLKTQFSNFEDTKSTIEKNSKTNNTAKARVQILLKVIDWYPFLNIDKTKYLEHFGIFKAISRADTRERNETEQILDFDTEYLPIVLEKSDNEKFKLIVQMFKYAPVRDDYQLIITDNIEDTKNKNNNYIRVYTKNKMAKTTVYINTSKTSDKYTMPDGIDFPVILSQNIKKYIKDKNLKKSEYLFGSSLLSGFVIAQNAKIGIDGGFDLLRRMKVKTISELPVNDRFKWANIMGHSFNTQDTHYRSSAVPILK